MYPIHPSQSSIKVNKIKIVNPDKIIEKKGIKKPETKKGDKKDAL